MNRSANQSDLPWTELGLGLFRSVQTLVRSVGTTIYMVRFDPVHLTILLIGDTYLLSHSLHSLAFYYFSRSIKFVPIICLKIIITDCSFCFVFSFFFFYYGKAPLRLQPYCPCIRRSFSFTAFCSISLGCISLSRVRRHRHVLISPERCSPVPDFRLYVRYRHWPTWCCYQNLRRHRSSVVHPGSLAVSSFLAIFLWCCSLRFCKCWVCRCCTRPNCCRLEALF